MAIVSARKSIRLVMQRALVSIAPATWVGLSAALSFYALSPFYNALPFLALVMAGPATTLMVSPLRHRIAGTILLCLAFGFMLGYSASLALLASVPPPELAISQRFSMRGAILGDSKKTASGNSVFTIELQTLSFDMPGIHARLQWPRRYPRILLVTDSDNPILGGQAIEARGVVPIPGASSMVFAPKSSIVIDSPPPPAALFRNTLRKTLVSRIHAVSGKSYALAQALLLGIKDDIDSQEAALFREAGCAHILALSGQHLSILCMLMTLLFARLLKRQDLAGWATIVFASFFTWLAGASPSLFRACSMTIITIAAKASDRPQHGFSILSLVFCATLLVKPSDAATLSFQLSYAAMAGLIIFSGSWESFLWKIPTCIAKPLAASLAALCATSSITLGIFGRLPLGGLLSATLSGPVVLLFMWSLLGASLLGSAIPFLDSVFMVWHEGIHALLTYIMRLGAALPALVPPKMAWLAIFQGLIVLISLIVYAWGYIEYVWYETLQVHRRNRSR